MPPFIKTNVNDVLDSDIPDLEPSVELKGDLNDLLEAQKNEKPVKLQIVWRNVMVMGMLHLGAIYGATLCFGTAKWQTVVAGMCFKSIILSFCVINFHLFSLEN